MVMRFPDERFSGHLMTKPASIMDVFPTIAEVAELPAVPALDGQSLISALAGKPTEPRPIVLHLSRRNIRLRSIVLNGWKLIYDPRFPERRRLFHLREDPAEQVDRVTSDPAVADRLQRMLVEVVGTDESIPTDAQHPLSDDQVRALKALGYLE
jgi:arylsulfatase A-like enzyme